MRPASLKRQTSAGGIIFKNEGEESSVALVAVRAGAVWTLPKGLIEKGEKPEETAVREVREETGLEARIVDFLGSVSYWYFMRNENTKYRKTVYYYLMELQDGAPEDHDREVDEVAWFSVGDALKVLTYRGDIEIMGRAKDILRDARKSGSPAKGGCPPFGI
ncbi:putative mutator protein MutT4 [bacterium BMS3Abin08]|nr:putative mutator protein MutT4 [bacterium BMS3Abin08]